MGERRIEGYVADVVNAVMGMITRPSHLPFRFALHDMDKYSGLSCRTRLGCNLAARADHIQGLLDAVVTEARGAPIRERLAVQGH